MNRRSKRKPRKRGLARSLSLAHGKQSQKQVSTGRSPLPTISIYLIGSGFGESIVLRWGDDNYGVIDSYSSRTGKTPTAMVTIAHPTIDLLSRLKVKNLEFLAVTHLHEDHVRGLVDLMCYFNDGENIAQFLLFPEFNSASLFKALRGVAKLGLKTHLEKVFKEKAGESFHEFTEFLVQVQGLKEAKKRVKRTREIRKFSFSEDLQIVSFGVPEDVQNSYIEQMNQQLEKLVTTGEGNIEQNMICPVFYVRFGKTVLLLGADREEENWKICLDDIRAELGDVDVVKFVKVGHHGSDNGFCEGLYGMLTPDFTAGITPWITGGNQLPRAKGVKALDGFAKEVYVTNADMTDLTELDFKPSKQIEEPQLEPSDAARLLKLLVSNPSWKIFFRGTNEVDQGLQSMPKDLMAFLKNEPQFIHELKAGVRKSAPYPIDQYGASKTRCISFTFDAEGNQIGEGEVGEDVAVYRFP